MPKGATTNNRTDNSGYEILPLANVEFRLVPNRLIAYDFSFAMLFSAYGLFFLWPNAKWCWDDIGLWLWTFVSCFGLWFLIPAFLHVVVTRPRVLTTLNAPVPYAFRDWFLGLPAKVIETTVHDGTQIDRIKRWGRLSWLLIKWQSRILQLPTSTDPTVWQPSSSGSAGMLNLAMADYFCPDGQGWADASKATLRFLITYCAPLWTSYFWLILTIALFPTAGFSRPLLCFAWTLFAVIFLVQAVIRYSYKLREDVREHLRALSFFPVWETLSSPKDMMIIRERWIQLIAGSLPALGLGLALAALQVLQPPGTN